MLHRINNLGKLIGFNICLQNKSTTTTTTSYVHIISAAVDALGNLNNSREILNCSLGLSVVMLESFINLSKGEDASKSFMNWSSADSTTPYIFTVSSWFKIMSIKFGDCKYCTTEDTISSLLSVKFTPLILFALGSYIQGNIRTRYCKIHSVLDLILGQIISAIRITLQRLYYRWS